MTKEDVLRGKETLLYDWEGLMVLSSTEIALIVGIFLLLIYDYYNVHKLKKEDTRRYTERWRRYKIRSTIIVGVLVLGYSILSVMNIDLKEVDNYANHPNYDKWVKEYVKPFLEEQEKGKLKIENIDYKDGRYIVKLQEDNKTSKTVELTNEEINIVKGDKKPTELKVVFLEDHLEYHFTEDTLIPYEKLEIGEDYLKEIKNKK